MNVDFLPMDLELISEVLGMMEEFSAIDGYIFDQATRSQNLQEFLNNPELGRLWVIRVRNENIGYVALTFGFSFEYMGKDAFIDELFIKSEFRGKGVGYSTMEFVEGQANILGVKAIHLEVEVSNERGNRLYKKCRYLKSDRTLLTKKIF